ncbi:MAG: hypothetical protein LC122_12305 [Chitinophagales bacterium]|nr:hypothetical protein [Chitinophagales bacterium]
MIFNFQTFPKEIKPKEYSFEYNNIKFTFFPTSSYIVPKTKGLYGIAFLANAVTFIQIYKIYTGYDSKKDLYIPIYMKIGEIDTYKTSKSEGIINYDIQYIFYVSEDYNEIKNRYDGIILVY